MTEAVELPGPDQPVSFAAHIRPLFRERDKQSMSWAFDLGSYDDVRARGVDPGPAGRRGMPCDGAWPAERVEVFRRWAQTGMQPLSRPPTDILGHGVMPHRALPGGGRRCVIQPREGEGVRRAPTSCGYSCDRSISLLSGSPCAIIRCRWMPIGPIWRKKSCPAATLFGALRVVLRVVVCDHVAEAGAVASCSISYNRDHQLLAGELLRRGRGARIAATVEHRVAADGLSQRLHEVPVVCDSPSG